MNEFQVVFYEKENNDRPIEEFLDSLDVKMRSKLVGLLVLLQEHGNELREPYSKHISDGIYELRCQVGNNISRVFYFFHANRIIVLTNGFIKKKQKTPQKEIKLAKEYRKDYLERIGKK